MTASLRSALFRHDNRYAVDPLAEDINSPRISVSCVVPYFNTGSLTQTTLRLLDESLAAFAAIHQDPPATQIILIDDGSREPFWTDRSFTSPLQIIRLAENRGRAVARNIGLIESAAFDVALFLDSDVLVSRNHVQRMCELMTSSSTTDFTRAIVAGLFSTRTAALPDVNVPAVLDAAQVSHDWRWSCRYQPTWVGTPSDWLYVGLPFRLVEDTSFFKDWEGMLGPWCLANMVLGGCFAVPVRESLSIGGFDVSFSSYGFTETTLIAKLIAEGVPVIPQCKTAAVHVETNPAHYAQADRSKYFEVAHRKFFQEFLA
ncbi:MAG: hypothetical protein JWP11_3475 [Frankiales bacterium]|nr:hypothetical protein [Frankiales bacterium]